MIERNSSSACAFDYMYRDAGSWKTLGSLLMTGPLDGSEAIIRSYLDWADQFVAEQIGVPLELIDRMRAASGRWDVTLSPNCWL